MRKRNSHRSDIFSGIFSTTTATSSSLTLQDIDMVFEQMYMNSRDADTRLRAITILQSQDFIKKALDQKIISEKEYWHLFVNIQVNGQLAVSPTMSTRLEQVQ